MPWWEKNWYKLTSAKIWFCCKKSWKSNVYLIEVVNNASQKFLRVVLLVRSEKSIDGTDWCDQIARNKSGRRARGRLNRNQIEIWKKQHWNWNGYTAEIVPCWLNQQSSVQVQRDFDYYRLCKATKAARSEKMQNIDKTTQWAGDSEASLANMHSERIIELLKDVI
jgi:hypothetical protein